MEEQSVDEEELWSILEPPVREACEKFVQTRTQEGHNLEKDLLEKLDGLDKKVTRIEERSPEDGKCLQDKAGSQSFRAS